jgi:hypothetical protein
MTAESAAAIITASAVTAAASVISIGTTVYLSAQSDGGFFLALPLGTSRELGEDQRSRNQQKHCRDNDCFPFFVHAHAPIKRYVQRRRRYASISRFPLGPQQSGSVPLGGLRNFFANNKIPAKNRITKITVMKVSIFSLVLLIIFIPSP